MIYIPTIQENAEWRQGSLTLLLLKEDLRLQTEGKSLTLRELILDVDRLR